MTEAWSPDKVARRAFMSRMQRMGHHLCECPKGERRDRGQINPHMVPEAGGYQRDRGTL